VEDRSSEIKILEILKDRCSSYAFLSQIYREEVSSTLLAEMANGLDLTVEEDTTGEGLRILKDFARKLKRADLKKVETELATEYASLFLNGRNHSVFPYESVYTSKKRLVMQKARDEVLSEYRQEGLETPKEFNEPEDHITIELEFMRHLCRKAVENMEQGNPEACLAYLRKQKEFLEKHLWVWIPNFCEDLARTAQSDFYKGIAKVTGDYLSLEQETISELIDELQS